MAARQPQLCCQEGNAVPSTLNPVATLVQSRLDTGWCATEASGWGGQGTGWPGHRAKASAKISWEREWAVHGMQNKICSIPSVSTLFQRMTYWTFPGIAVPSLSTVSWKYTQEKWLPSSRDLQKVWTGSRLQSVAEVVMLLHQLIWEQRLQGPWRKSCFFSPSSSSHQMATMGREGVIFFFADCLSSLVCLSLLAVSSSKQIGKPAVLHMTGLPARPTVYLGCFIGNH